MPTPVSARVYPPFYYIRDVIQPRVIYNHYLILSNVRTPRVLTLNGILPTCLQPQKTRLKNCARLYEYENCTPPSINGQVFAYYIFLASYCINFADESGKYISGVTRSAIFAPNSKVRKEGFGYHNRYSIPVSIWGPKYGEELDRRTRRRNTRAGEIEQRVDSRLKRYLLAEN